jgi:GNAT superfamily N-acetyltransferase
MVVTEPVADRPAGEGVAVHWLDRAEDHAFTVGTFVDLSDAAYRSLGMPAGTFLSAVAAPHLVEAPGTTVVLATVDGVPVGAAMALLSHGIAGVYFVGTLEAARGKGIGDLVTRAVTNRAFDDGARAVTLQASPMGEAIYARMGYRELYRYTTYVRFASG